jgi:hypothetical protein
MTSSEMSLYILGDETNENNLQLAAILAIVMSVVATEV